MTQPGGAIPHHVVVVGAGFGGLYAARRLGRDKRVQLTLIDRRNFHLFQPLLYQVATGALAPGEIAQPLRSILRRNRNTRVVLGQAADIDPVAHEVVLSDGGRVGYDSLVIATGARFSYFGNDAWAKNAPGLKTVDDATEIRRRIFIAFEAAEREANPERRAEWMTFVIVGPPGRPASSWPALWVRSRTTPCAATSATSTPPTHGSCWWRPWSASCRRTRLVGQRPRSASLSASA